MTETQLYQQCDEVLGPVLETKGFRREKPACYARRVTDGEERISVSKGPPSKARTHFSVWISYHPDYLQQVYELYDVEKWDCGSLTPPYLTPVGATFNPKYWSCGSGEALEKSLHHVIVCLEQAGFRWLETLHDPKIFAEQSDSTAALPYGLANEVAGYVEKAKAGYEDMLTRLNKLVEMYRQKGYSEQKIIDLFSKDAKPFIFVAAKLGVETERANFFRKKLNFHSHIKPLPLPR